MTLDAANTTASHCLLLTLTAPSRMHALRVGPHGREANPEYDGSTPRDTQAYLRKTWACIRASFKRHGAKCWGIREVEPHFDGTPHWHVLMWVEGGDLSLADAMRVCQGPATDTKNTICVMAPPHEGVGYISKYLAKCVAPDDERVSSWAAVWGLRLFSRFGTWPEGGAA